MSRLLAMLTSQKDPPMSDEAKALELLPCPFCGGGRTCLGQTIAAGLSWWEVFCETCTGRTSTASKAEAIAAWNTRAVPLKHNTDGLTDKQPETPQKTAVSDEPLVSLERGPTTPEVERLIAQAQFLSDRLDDLDWSMEYDEFGSAYYGHVAPAHSRLKETLAALDAVEAAGGASELKR